VGSDTSGEQPGSIDLIGVPPGSRSLTPTLLTGRWFEAGDEHAIVINTHLADAQPDLAVGGLVELEIEGRRQRWSIVGISTTTLVGPVAYVPADDLAESVGAPKDTNLLAVQLGAGVDQAAAAERLGALARAGGLPVGEVQTNEQMRMSVESMFDLAVALLLLVGAILAVVAVVGVAGTMTLGVLEQTREIGVLRTLGASTWSVRRLLLVQGLAIAAVGALLGVLLSVPVSLLLGAAIGDSLISAAMPTAFSWLGVGIWSVVALLIGVVGATQPSRAAARLTIRDTLAYQ
jgi:putative ABC transport system permease protein